MVEEAKTTPRKPAHKTHLLFNADGLNVELDIRFEKFTAEDVKERNKIIIKDLGGNLCAYKSFYKADTLMEKGDSRKFWVNTKGEKIPK